MTAPFLVPYHADPNDCFRYTKQGLEFLFTNEGFNIVESSYYGKVFSVLSEMIRFVFFNPHGKPRGIWTRRFLRYLAKISRLLDKLVKTNIIYTNTYIIAKK